MISLLATAQLPVLKRHEMTLRQMGAAVVQAAVAQAGIDPAEVQAIVAANMLADELQGQKHLAALIADEAGLAGVEALHVRAATAAGAAALRVGGLLIQSGAAEIVVVVGVEKMSDQMPTQPLAKALDAEKEVPDGATMVSQAARLMALYQETYGCPADALDHFAVNAHAHANGNPKALFHDKIVTLDDVRHSRLIVPPLRLYDCAPICDGAAAVVLGATARFPQAPVKITAAHATTDRFRIFERPQPLALEAAGRSVEAALRESGIGREQISLFEPHDAFSIMACLALEAGGFARPGHGWRLAAEGELGLGGWLPTSTMGGLKGRGHPIGATALYQTCEIFAQLTGTAGVNQLKEPSAALMQSLGGPGTSVFTHVFTL